MSDELIIEAAMNHGQRSRAGLSQYGPIGGYKALCATVGTVSNVRQGLLYAQAFRAVADDRRAE